jgi:uncharacterized phage protein (TIGR01671 family)
MREIKFRAWDKQFKLMLIVDKLYLNQNLGITRCDLYNEETGLMGDGGDLKNLIFLQYTGLKDKSGKEIFEGDIIRNHGQNNQLSIVEGKPTIRTISGHGDCTYIAGVFYFGYYGDGKEIEVVGNIYENPELLNDE